MLILQLALLVDQVAQHQVQLILPKHLSHGPLIALLNDHLHIGEAAAEDLQRGGDQVGRAADRDPHPDPALIAVEDLFPLLLELLPQRQDLSGLLQIELKQGIAQAVLHPGQIGG